VGRSIALYVSNAELFQALRHAAHRRSTEILALIQNQGLPFALAVCVRRLKLFPDIFGLLEIVEPEGNLDNEQIASQKAANNGA
jgi:hypothetical protein